MKLKERPPRWTTWVWEDTWLWLLLKIFPRLYRSLSAFEKTSLHWLGYIEYSKQMGKKDCQKQSSLYMGKRFQYNICCLRIYYCLYRELTGLWLAWVLVIKLSPRQWSTCLMISMRSAPMLLHLCGCGYPCWQDKTKMNVVAYTVGIGLS